VVQKLNRQIFKQTPFQFNFSKCLLSVAFSCVSAVFYAALLMLQSMTKKTKKHFSTNAIFNWNYFSNRSFNFSDFSISYDNLFLPYHLHHWIFSTQIFNSTSYNTLIFFTMFNTTNIPLDLSGSSRPPVGYIVVYILFLLIMLYVILAIIALCVSKTIEKLTKPPSTYHPLETIT